VTSVTFVLSTAAQPVLHYRDLVEHFGDAQPEQAAIREAVIAIRSRKFPDWHRVGTAGSFFKNPTVSAEQFARLRTAYPELPGYPQADGSVKVALGWILEHILKRKGTGTDTVGCYEGQALVLFNKGGATAADVTAFAQTITTEVKEATGIDIAWEVTKW